MGLHYEDKIELMWGGEVGEEMYGPFGNAAVSNVVELAAAQPQAEIGAEQQQAESQAS
jgi:hypothetical protein